MNFSFAIDKIDRLGDRRSKSPAREIAIIKLADDDGVEGIAELAPLSSWNHPTVEAILSSSHSSNPHSLWIRVVELAKRDYQAKKRGFSLLNEAAKISNHKLLHQLDEQAASALGIVKVKLGGAIEKETEQLVTFLSKSTNCKVRIDFNGYFESADKFINWWRYFSCKSQLDFIEDPVLTATEWDRIISIAPEIKLAADQILGEVEAKVLVLKPSWQEPFEILKNYDRNVVEVVVTHVLGGALDQAQSLAEALGIKADGWKLSACGLQSINSHFVQKDGRIYPPENSLGYAITSDDYRLEWHKL